MCLPWGRLLRGLVGCCRFGDRHCYDLTYECQKESDKFDNYFEKLGLGLKECCSKMVVENSTDDFVREIAFHQ